MMMPHVWPQNGPFVPNPQFQAENFFVLLPPPKKFFWMNHWQHLKKFLEWIQNNYMSFLGPKWHICHEREFVWKNRYYNFDGALGLFYCKKKFKGP